MAELAGAAEFTRQLEELGYAVKDHGESRVSVSYGVPCGGWRGKDLQLGFEVPSDFPRTPPHGPHFSPALLPVNPGVDTHPERVHDSPLGSDWIQWSRPIQNWDQSDRSVRTYLAWIKSLFCTVPIKESK